ncbi:ATP synthase epsilon chain, sodium ion specific [Pirellulimonas nuda]|uniref:ATP synthase epsilon chain n=1 Tax=Pirellulimonas nuda TaxID=2528009 RepID=A0A518DAX0_9BACT|nr:ATP synthase F1 subunit epsilon [Pirellulimonas nuda]QDU88629.1 ATP synthase epsilon chain, sodium ion specific [Pirellulimonas nuda]
MADPQSNELHVSVVTPEQTVLETVADFVTVPLFDGEIGIGHQHSPMIGRLGYGEMRVRSAGATVRYYVDGGFVQVEDDRIAVLTGRAVLADQVDAAAATAQLAEAQGRPASGPEEIAVRDRLVSQARGQLRVAGKKA